MGSTTILTEWEDADTSLRTALVPRTGLGEDAEGLRKRAGTGLNFMGLAKLMEKTDRLENEMEDEMRELKETVDRTLKRLVKKNEEYVEAKKRLEDYQAALLTKKTQMEDLEGRVREYGDQFTSLVVWNGGQKRAGDGHSEVSHDDFETDKPSKMARRT